LADTPVLETGLCRFEPCPGHFREWLTRIPKTGARRHPTPRLFDKSIDRLCGRGVENVFDAAPEMRASSGLIV
jgi:hypothetical protein